MKPDRQAAAESLKFRREWWQQCGSLGDSLLTPIESHESRILSRLRTISDLNVSECCKGRGRVADALYYVDNQEKREQGRSTEQVSPRNLQQNNNNKNIKKEGELTPSDYNLSGNFHPFSVIAEDNHWRSMIINRPIRSNINCVVLRCKELPIIRIRFRSDRPGNKCHLFCLN